MWLFSHGDGGPRFCASCEPTPCGKPTVSAERGLEGETEAGSTTDPNAALPSGGKPRDISYGSVGLVGIGDDACARAGSRRGTQSHVHVDLSVTPAIAGAMTVAEAPEIRGNVLCSSTDLLTERLL